MDLGRGLLSGAFWGVLASGLVVAVASLLAEQPPGNTPPSPPQVNVPSAEGGESDASPDAVAAQTDGTQGVSAPQVSSPDAPPSLPMADTNSADVPQTSAVEADITAPQSGEAPRMDTSALDPVLPNPQSAAPQQPSGEEGLSISTDPAQPPQPEVETTVEEEFIAVDPSGEAAPEVVIITDEAPMGQDSPAIDAPEATVDAVVVETAPAEAPIVPEPPQENTAPPQPTDASTDASTAEPDDDTLGAAQTPPETDDLTTQNDIQRDAEANETTLPTVDSTAPSLGLASADTAPSMPKGDDSVRINRPTGSNSLIPTQTAETLDAPEANTPEQGALKTYAAPPNNPDGKPLLAFVLIDDASADTATAVAALTGLPFDVTIGIDATLQGADTRMGLWRAGGFEIIALASIPTGAQPSDVEVTLQAAFAMLPEAIGLLDAGEGGLQDNRAVTDQTMAILAAEGRGLITISKGLNMAQRAAENAEIPAAVIYRDLDSNGQDARTIRRFIDQAAFRARQESGVVLLGRVRADTISALTLWGTANRTGQVALGPVSGALLGLEGALLGLE